MPRTNSPTGSARKPAKESPAKFSPPAVCTLGDLLAKELPPLVPVVSPWLHSGESCLLWGGTGTGKSMLAQTVALAVSGGGRVLGWECPKPQRVLYIDGEQSVRDIRDRWRMLPSAIERHDSAAAARNLHLVARSAQAEAGGFLDITNEAHHAAISALVTKGDFGLVVFDNFSTLSDSLEDENNAAAVRPMQSLLAHLKGLNVAVILVHHAKKDGMQFRGSTGILTTFERVLGLVRVEGGTAAKIEGTLKLEKFRGKLPEGFRLSMPVTFETTEDADGQRAAWQIGEDNSAAMAGWEMFKRGGYATKAEFVAAFNARFRTNHRAGNFGRDFVTPWMRGGVGHDDIRKAEAAIAYLRQARQQATPKEF